MKSVLLLSLLAIAGCSSGPRFNPQTANFSKASTGQLCRVYGERPKVRVDEARAELVRRNALSEAEWKAIDTRKLEPNMSECALFASYPESAGDVTYEYRDASGKVVGMDIDWSCRDAPLPFCPTTRVVLRSGSIRSFAKISPR